MLFLVKRSEIERSQWDSKRDKIVSKISAKLFINGDVRQRKSHAAFWLFYCYLRCRASSVKKRHYYRKSGFISTIFVTTVEQQSVKDQTTADIEKCLPFSFCSFSLSLLILTGWMPFEGSAGLEKRLFNESFFPLFLRYRNLRSWFLSSKITKLNMSQKMSELNSWKIRQNSSLQFWMETKPKIRQMKWEKNVTWWFDEKISDFHKCFYFDLLSNSVLEYFQRYQISLYSFTKH